MLHVARVGGVANAGSTPAFLGSGPSARPLQVFLHSQIKAVKKAVEKRRSTKGQFNVGQQILLSSCAFAKGCCAMWSGLGCTQRVGALKAKVGKREKDKRGEGKGLGRRVDMRMRAFQSEQTLVSEMMCHICTPSLLKPDEIHHEGMR